MSDIVERLRKMAACVHIAVEPGPAADLEEGMLRAADEIERLRRDVLDADARGDAALRRAHRAEAVADELRNVARWLLNNCGTIHAANELSAIADRLDKNIDAEIVTAQPT